ncbi:SpoIIE family protein phosphatase [Sinomonas sp. ASV322]|uniref:SpoIIE family protein phosphatase n=1 Tax=Sinomonas sp. ASV322 TaxID=3041920 RepID=UPI0027DCA991|nr:SpoIIE family protein phosphatase [Sinomonas sp. ASV322]MDQ4501505.1 SpoIIE family protein phosphatase [Sinomonas sp. ASV322]
MTRRALVIEDNPDIRRLLEATLSRQGFDATSAGAGYPALEAARRIEPDLITLDLGLPDLDGLEVCRTLRMFSNAYILVVTARAAEADRLEALDRGADDVLPKPFSPRELQARVEALFRRPRAAAAPETELQTAARVQRGLLPDRAPDVPGYDIAGACHPSRSVGGDFFDWESDGASIAFTLADAMGKGMGAALVAATARAVLRPGRLDHGPGALVGTAARALEPDLLRLGSFVTLLHTRLDAATGDFTYVDAGHGLGVLIHPDGMWERLETSGPPIGLLQGAEWTARDGRLEPGGTLVALSDGLLEGYARVEEALDAATAAIVGAPDAAAAVSSVISLDSTNQDDTTVIVVRRAPAGASPQGTG